MTRKPKDNDAQSKRFIETAKKLEVDENPEAFERAFKKVVPAKKHGAISDNASSAPNANPKAK